MFLEKVLFIKLKIFGRLTTWKRVTGHGWPSQEAFLRRPQGTYADLEQWRRPMKW